jgi:hypothetical protein
LSALAATPIKSEMEPIHARFDTTVGCAYFNIQAETLPPEIATKIANVNRRRKETRAADAAQEYLALLRGVVELTNYPLLVHEWSHALQAVTHPALYVRCLSELSAVCAVVDELRKTPNDLPLPLVVDKRWQDELLAQITPIRIEIGSNGVPVAEPPGDRTMPNDVSAGDLLEDTASIFQYRAEIEADGAVSGYRRWLKERHRYSKTFELVSKAIGAEETYLALPALVMAAYATTSPLRCFVWLLEQAAAGELAPASEVGAEGYLGALDEALRQTFNSIAPEPRLYESHNQRLLYIDREAVLGLAREWEGHPLSAVVKRAWADELQIGRLREAMLHPWQALSRREHHAREWVEPYGPPVAAFRVLGDDRFGLGDTAMKISDTVIEESPKMSKTDWQWHIIELVRMKAFVFAAATRFLNKQAHNCPHDDCRFHQHDLCRAWIHIPPRPQECVFPEWLEQRAGRKVDFEAAKLVSVGSG